MPPPSSHGLPSTIPSRLAVILGCRSLRQTILGICLLCRDLYHGLSSSQERFFHATSKYCTGDELARLSHTVVSITSACTSTLTIASLCLPHINTLNIMSSLASYRELTSLVLPVTKSQTAGHICQRICCILRRHRPRHGDLFACRVTCASSVLVRSIFSQ